MVDTSKNSSKSTSWIYIVNIVSVVGWFLLSLLSSPLWVVSPLSPLLSSPLLPG